MFNVLRASLRCVRLYSTSWLNAVSTPAKRTRLLCDLGVCLVIHAVAINNHRQLLDSNLADYHAPAGSSADAFPDSNPSPPVRSCGCLLAQFPCNCAVTAVIKAAAGGQPAGQLVAVLHIRATVTASMIIFVPSIFLRWRSYVHLLGLLCTSTILYSSLITHPFCASCHSLAALIVNSGVGLITQQIICNVSGLDV